MPFGSKNFAMKPFPICSPSSKVPSAPDVGWAFGHYQRALLCFSLIVILYRFLCTCQRLSLAAPLQSVHTHTTRARRSANSTTGAIDVPTLYTYARARIHDAYVFRRRARVCATASNIKGLE